ncbi:hypothetical protein VWO21_10935, partial [Streptococcus pneumoniae]
VNLEQLPFYRPGITLSAVADYAPGDLAVPLGQSVKDSEPVVQRELMRRVFPELGENVQFERT